MIAHILSYWVQVSRANPRRAHRERTSKPKGVIRAFCTLVPLQPYVNFSFFYNKKCRRADLDGVYP
jgi:hypothetical protein